MGGSGSRRRLTDQALRALESAARDALREADGPARRNVFLSFAYEDLADVNLLRGQAKNERTDLEFVDRSVRVPFDSQNAEYIRRGIRERIRQSSVTLVYVSEHTADSRWVDWEIRESVRLGKGVVAVHSGEAPPARLPPAIREERVPVVRWNAKAVTETIERAARQRADPEGSA